jgi:hypothetical protein
MKTPTMRSWMAAGGGFCYEFVVGDTPEIAAGVGVLIVLAWALSLGGGRLSVWLLPPAVAALLLGSLWRGRSAG